MLPWEPAVQLKYIHCRSDNSTGGRHPGIIGALPEGCTTQPKQCFQCQTSRQITVCNCFRTWILDYLWEGGREEGERVAELVYYGTREDIVQS